jgi:DUF917 family protein
MKKTMRELDLEDVNDLLVGAKLLGCGGGGEAEWSRPLIDEIYGAGKRFRVIDPSEMSSEKLVMIVGTVGGGVTEEDKKIVENLPQICERPELVAMRELADYLREEPYAILPTEIGAGNMIVSLYVAAVSGKYTIDGDACGRAKPEIAISTTHVRGVPITPMAIVTPFGEKIIVKTVTDDYRGERIARNMAVLSGGRCGVARCPMVWATAKDAIVWNSISKSIQLGQRLREDHLKDPAHTVETTIGGRRLFEGSIQTFERKEQGGFMWATTILKGESKYEGHTLRAQSKNEHIATWLDGKPLASVPDLILMVDQATGHGLSVWGNDFSANRRIVVMAAPSPSIWRSPKGMEIFGPNHFGLDFDFVPVERLKLQSVLDSDEMK